MIIEYGFRKDYDIIGNIIIDDGNELRSRRHSLMDHNKQYLGIGIQ